MRDEAAGESSPVGVAELSPALQRWVEAN